MILRTALAGALLFAAPAAFAEDIRDTHVELHVPAGKLPNKLYRPISRNDCATVQAHRQSGKLPIAPLATADDANERCRTRVVERNAGPRG